MQANTIISNMNKKPQLRLLSTLMICSQLMLMVFVFIWLRGQYREEQNTLQKDIAESVLKIRQQVLDSMLVQEYINPILSGGSKFKIHLDTNSSSLPHPKELFKQKIELTSTAEVLPGDSVVKIFVDSNGTRHENTLTFFHTSDSAKDFLLQGVKMIVKEVASNENKEKRFEHTVYANADTQLLHQLLASKFSTSGWQFNAKWIQRSDSSSHTSLPGALYFDTQLYPNSYGVTISGYSHYLWNKILPQIFFGFIVILLAGSAFLFAYRTLKKQVLLNTMRNDFIDNISHELKTPVSTVKVVVEALQDANIRAQEKKTEEYLDMAAKEVSRLEMLITKVLNSSLMDEDPHSMEKTEINIHSLIAEIISSFQIRVRECDGVINFSSNGNSFQIKADRLHLQGAIMNLIDNALKYSGPQPVVSISLDSVPAGFVLKVSDSGPGIPEKYRDKIFDKFFRVPNESGHLIKGHGLGLTYTSSVIRQHGGTITFENLSSGGACFLITLPHSSV